jgi:hypothetical protein
VDAGISQFIRTTNEQPNADNACCGRSISIVGGLPLDLADSGQAAWGAKMAKADIVFGSPDSPQLAGF